MSVQVLVYDNSDGEIAEVFKDGCVDLMRYDRRFASEAEAIEWLTVNDYQYAGVDNVE